MKEDYIYFAKGSRVLFRKETFKKCKHQLSGIVDVPRNSHNERKMRQKRVFDLYKQIAAA